MPDLPRLPDLLRLPNLLRQTPCRDHRDLRRGLAVGAAPVGDHSVARR